MSVLLQVCTGKSGPDHLTDFEFMEAIACTYGNEIGLLITGLLFFGAIYLAIFITTGDIRIPAVLFFLTGGAMTPLVASPALSIAVIALLFLGGGVSAALYYRYAR